MGEPGTSSTGRVARWLDRVERLGNKLPDPITIFVLLAAGTAAASALVAAAGWSLEHPGTGETIEAVNLLSPAQLQRMLTEAVANFTSFKPLGVVLVAMLGIGVAERSGLISTLLKLAVTGVPRPLVSAALVAAGVLSSLAADVGYVVLVPLGAVVFAGLGRHPLAGLAAAFAGVSGGFSANFLITALDPLLAGLSEEAARLIDDDYTVAATCNWYFMIVSVFLVTGLGWWVTDRIVEPRLGTWKGAGGDGADRESGGVAARQPLNGESEPKSGPSMSAVTHRERVGALWAGVAFFAVLAGIALLSWPEGALLRDAEGTLAPLQASIVPLMFIAFFVPGLVYGLVTGTVRSDRAVARMTAETMNTMGVYITLAFVAAQFVAWFRWSHLGEMLAIGGAELLQGVGAGGLGLILAFIVVAMAVNLFIGSSSAKWAIMAPVFVPMLMQMGFSPELTQAAYRVGDSVTNIITPLMPYFPIVVAFAQKYEPDMRLGTLIAAMLPYSIAFALGWVVLLTIWYALGLPLGPGAPMGYAAG